MELYLKKGNYDTYNCDYTGQTYNLIGSLNKKITSKFLPKFEDSPLKDRIKEKLKGNYKSIHLVLRGLYGEPLIDHDSNITKQAFNLYIDCEYTDNLTSVEKDETNLDEIQKVVDEYFLELGYPLYQTYNAMKMYEMLATQVPEMNEYFEIR